HGMLYHSAFVAAGPMYVEQFTCRITGSLNTAAFQTAWEQTIAEQAALRTAIIWRDVEHPVQVVFSRVDAPWTLLDWRELPPDAQTARLEAFADADRRKGFDLATPPLLRFALIRTHETTWRFYWTWHHIILDGWSTAVVLQDVF